MPSTSDKSPIPRLALSFSPSIRLQPMSRTNSAKTKASTTRVQIIPIARPLRELSPSLKADTLLTYLLLAWPLLMLSFAFSVLATTLSFQKPSTAVSFASPRSFLSTLDSNSASSTPRHPSSSSPPCAQTLACSTSKRPRTRLFASPTSPPWQNSPRSAMPCSSSTTRF